MIALNIGDSIIRATLFHGRTVKTAVSAALEPGLVKDGLILDPPAVSRRITELFSYNGFSETKVIASITGIHSMYRLARLPKLKGSLMEEAIRHEMTRAMPVPMDQVYLSWQAWPVSSNEILVAMIGLPRNVADAMAATLKQADLSCTDFDLRPMAAARAAGDPDALVINVQQTGFDIIIIAGGLPRLIRCLPFASPGAPLANNVNLVKDEIDRTINYYNSEQPEKPISDSSNLYITGPFTNLLVDKIRPAHNPLPLPQLLSYPENTDPGEWAVNSGLALKQAKLHSDPIQAYINVLPQVYQPKPFPVMQVAAYLFVLIALAIIAVQAMATAQSLSITEALQSKVDVMDKSVQGIQAAQPQVKKVQDQLTAVKDKRDTLLQMQNELKSQRAKLNDGLAQITSLLPGTVIPGNIIYSTGTKMWTVAGTTTGSAIIINYVSALQSSRRFTEVLISTMQEVEVSKWSFTLNLK